MSIRVDPNVVLIRAICGRRTTRSFKLRSGRWRWPARWLATPRCEFRRLNGGLAF